MYAGSAFLESCLYRLFSPRPHRASPSRTLLSQTIWLRFLFSHGRKVYELHRDLRGLPRSKDSVPVEIL